MGEITKKIEGGKLLRMKASSSDGKISSISIEGDFFAYPENVIGEIERELLQKKIGADFEPLILQVLAENNSQLIGISAKDISLVLKEALK